MRRFDNLAKDELPVSPRIARLLKDLREEWAGLDRQLEAYDAELLTLTRSNEQARRLATIPGVGAISSNEQARRLATIPGVGAINATALLAAAHPADWQNSSLISVHRQGRTPEGVSRLPNGQCLKTRKNPNDRFAATTHRPV
jgi:transposase